MRVAFTLAEWGAVKLPRPAWAALKAECGDVPLYKPSYQKSVKVEHDDGPDTYEQQEIVPDDDETHVHVDGRHTLSGDLARVQAILPPETAIRVRGTAEPAPLQELAESIRRLESRIAGLALASGVDQGAYLNPKVNVHVPGLGMLMLDEVLLVEDACTDALNDNLAAGWRIVAVCPQPDQRRPDYILGRQTPHEGARP